MGIQAVKAIFGTTSRSGCCYYRLERLDGAVTLPRPAKGHDVRVGNEISEQDLQSLLSLQAKLCPISFTYSIVASKE